MFWLCESVGTRLSRATAVNSVITPAAKREQNKSRGNKSRELGEVGVAAHLTAAIAGDLPGGKGWSKKEKKNKNRKKK